MIVRARSEVPAAAAEEAVAAVVPAAAVGSKAVPANEDLGRSEG